jgi:hypothetical protein
VFTLWKEIEQQHCQAVGDPTIEDPIQVLLWQTPQVIPSKLLHMTMRHDCHAHISPATLIVQPSAGMHNQDQWVISIVDSDRP